MKQELESPWIAFDQTVSEPTDIAEEILGSLNIKPQKLKHVPSAFFGTEAFSFYLDHKRYMIQYSLGDCEKLITESLFLQKSKIPQKPQLLNFGTQNVYGESFTYNILGYDFAENLFENLGFLQYGELSLKAALSDLSRESFKINSPLKFYQQLDDDWRGVGHFIGHYSFIALHNIVNHLLADLKEVFAAQRLKSKQICHGDLKPQNIIILGNRCKIINWKYCVNIHPFFDSCCLAISIGGDQNFARSLNPSCLPKSHHLIWELAAKCMLVRSLTEYCYHTYSRQKSDGFVGFCAVSNVLRAASFLPEADIEFLKKLTSESFVEETEDCVDEGR